MRRASRFSRLRQSTHSTLDLKLKGDDVLVCFVGSLHILNVPFDSRGGLPAVVYEGGEWPGRAMVMLVTPMRRGREHSDLCG